VAELRPHLTTGELRVVDHHGVSPLLDACNRTRHHFVDFGDGEGVDLAVRVSVREEDRGAVLRSIEECTVKKGFLVTSNLRYMHGVLKGDKIKN
jgi:hypothetical protein